MGLFGRMATLPRRLVSAVALDTIIVDYLQDGMPQAILDDEARPPTTKVLHNKVQVARTQFFLGKAIELLYEGILRNLPRRTQSCEFPENDGNDRGDFSNIGVH